MSAPAVSVILPTFNRAHLLPRAIGSVLGQTCRDFELIVVDDGSSDDTASVVRGLADPRLVYLPPEGNLGDAGARNRGIASARGAWLAFQDSDDEWLPDKLERQLGFAARLPESVAVVGGGALRIEPGRVEPYRWPLAPGAGAEGGLVDEKSWLADGTAYLQTLLIRRPVLEAAGGFDRNLKARSDFDLCLRLLRSHGFAALREFVAVVYETPGSLLLDHRNSRHDYRVLLAQHGDLLGQDPRNLATWRYRLAIAELMCGDVPASRRMAWQAIAARPAFLRPWLYLALSLLGARGIRRLRGLSQSLRARARP